ncbi:MAG TPA: hypothetical protein VF242_00140 [Nitrososphaeraceae archaeon]
MQIHTSYSIANIFVITSLVLLLIYGADVALKNFNTGGFIPLDTITRGIIFGGIAVALSIIAFIISIREKSFFVSTLLIINGIIMIIGGLVIASNIINSSENALLISIVSGIIITSLGIWKKVGFRNITSGKNTLTQH